jgi:uncharacterized membrane-anchored protein YjiN (DUF445 family)
MILRDKALVDPGRRMRLLATLMLAGMAVVFIAAANLDDDPTGFWSFVKAFAEAAMVGGIADWFAVTALFRHPLGIPIPHTAIIPRNKDRIGGALASFLRTNFLVPRVVARRMRRVDVAAAAGRFLANPPSGGRVREGASRLLADVLEALDEDRQGRHRQSPAQHRDRPPARPHIERHDQRRPPHPAARQLGRLGRPRAGRQ